MRGGSPAARGLKEDEALPVVSADDRMLWGVRWGSGGGDSGGEVGGGWVVVGVRWGWLGSGGGEVGVSDVDISGWIFRVDIEVGSRG